MGCRGNRWLNLRYDILYCFSKNYRRRFKNSWFSFQTFLENLINLWNNLDVKQLPRKKKIIFNNFYKLIPLRNWKRKNLWIHGTLRNNGIVKHRRSVHRSNWIKSDGAKPRKETSGKKTRGRLSAPLQLIKFAFVSLWPGSSGCILARRFLDRLSASKPTYLRWKIRAERGNPLIPEERCPSHGPLCQLDARQTFNARSLVCTRVYEATPLADKWPSTSWQIKYLTRKPCRFLLVMRVRGWRKESNGVKDACLMSIVRKDLI